MRFNIPVTNQREPTGNTPAEIRDEYGGQPEHTLAAQARAIREELGMTQAEVAKEMSARGLTMRQSTIAKIEAGQRPVRVNEAVMLAGILHTSLADLLTEPGQKDRLDALAIARIEERELLGQLLVAGHHLENCRAAHAAATHAMHEAAELIEGIEAKYAEAQHMVAFLAAEGNEGSRP